LKNFLKYNKVGVKLPKDACLEEKNTPYAPLPALTDGKILIIIGTTRDNLAKEMLMECLPMLLLR
jgi:hypothetical protein